MRTLLATLLVLSWTLCTAPSCSDDASSTKDAGGQGGSQAAPRADTCPEMLDGAAAWKYEGDEEACAELARGLNEASAVDAGAADSGDDEECGDGIAIETKLEGDGECSAALILSCGGRTLSVACDDIAKDGSAECAASVRADELPGGECLLSLTLGASR